MITRIQLKREVLSILRLGDTGAMSAELARYEPKRLINPLFSALCHPEEAVRWHAILCFGKVVPAIAEQDMESARIVMRRFLWALNDESGGIGWGVPEAMAEVMCHSRELRREYLHMLLSYMREDGEELFQDGNYLELPMLQRGLLWGVARLCQEYRQEMLDQRVDDNVAAYLDSDDHYVNGLALWCLGLLGRCCSKERARRFLGSDTQLHLFVDSRMVTTSLGELAKKVVPGGEKERCSAGLS